MRIFFRSVNLLLAEIGLLLMVSTGVVQAQNEQDPDLRRATDFVSTAYKTLLMTKDYAEARRCFEAAVQIYKAKKGPEDQKYLEAVYGLADACEKLNDSDAALRYFKLYAEHTRVNPLRIYLRIGTLCERMKNFQEAAFYYGRSVALFECDSVKWNNDVSKCYHSLSAVQERLGDYKTALATVRQHIKSEKRYWGKDNNLLVAMRRAAMLCHRLGDDNQALREYDRCMTLLEEIEPDNNKLKNLNYAVILNDRGLSLKALCRYDEALADCQQSLKIRQAVQGIETIDYAVILNNIGSIFLAKGQYDEALQSFEQALKIYCEAVGCDNTMYVNCIANLGTVHSELGNYDRALRFSCEAVDGFRKYFGERHPDYAQSLSNLGVVYDHCGNYEESLRYHVKAAKLFAQTVGMQHPLYISTLNDIGCSQLQLGKLDDAKKNLSEACSLWCKIGEESSSNYAVALNNLAMVYSRECNFRDALTLYEKVAEIRCRILGTNHPDYAMTLNDIAVVYQKYGDFRRARDYQARSVEIIGLTKGIESPDAAVICHNLGSLYHALGNYAEAEKQYRNCANIQLKIKGDRHSDYAKVLNALGALYVDMQRYDEAVSCLEQCSRISLDTYGRQHPDYANYQSNIASVLNLYGQWEKAEQILLEVLKIYEASSLQNTTQYALALNKLAYTYSAQGQDKYNQAQALYRQSADILRKLLGPRHPDYLVTCNNIGLAALCAREYAMAERYMRELFEAIRENIRTDFIYLTEQERLLYWNTQQLHIANLFALGSDRVEGPTARLIYDASLLNKGLLLCTNIALETVIRDSKDERLIADFNELRALRYRLMKIRRAPQSTRDVDSLEQRATKMEISIQERSEAFGNYLKHTLVKWSDVRANLAKGEAAIEFVSYGFQTDTLYDALIIRRDCSSPQHVHLCSLKELRERMTDLHDPQIYCDPQYLNKYIWEPLEPYLSGVERLYFAPSGELYNIGVEYLPTPDGRRMCDRFQMIRLSSTRELVRTSAKSVFKSAALFGGLNYNTGIDDMILYAADYGVRGAMNDRFNRENLQISGAWNYLRGTRQEVDCIANMLSIDHCKISKYTGDEGVEETFKSLSGNGVELVHIATHGFYFPEEKVSREVMIGSNQLLREDQSLQRCGLVFTGANHIWLADSTIPEEIDDGILTGREISSMDLRGNDLVVLSACQTGVGKVTGEGVFGLQRAFKKAGAGTLLMSLWEVNDEVTQLMMTEFYRALVLGKSKHEALQQAQKRIHERTFIVNGEELSGIDPRFWAAFILMD